MTIQEILEAHRGTATEWCATCPDYQPTRDELDTIESLADELKVRQRHQAEMLEAHMQEREAQLRQLVRDMTDPGKCWFDHHGGCQEHGYLDLEPGELCPHAEAKQLLGDEPNGR